ncbi:MAG TPA: tetratricopeptide repeat protein [Terriglobales bacterium]|nr:tetratricopeptide repeat protein [Terriglobales bacterium]
MFRRTLPHCHLLLCVALVLTHATAAQTNPQAGHSGDGLSFRPNDALNRAAFDHFYNLDYDHAVQEFDQVLQRHPDDPFAVNHLLTAVLFRELYRMGVLNTGEYANDTFIRAAHRPGDPKVKQQIKDLVQRATQLEENSLDANPKDVDALYARGVTRAQFAAYTAMVEHAWFSALRNAVGARRDHERVLELAPQDTPAKLIVGAHNYVMGSLPLALRAGVTMLGIGGNKELGLQDLRECAEGTGDTSTDAKILLVLFLRRERRYPEALGIARGLIESYPRDVLMAVEEGNLLRAEGNDQEAAAVYRRVWQAGREGHYDGLHYEIAALSLGDLLRSEKDYANAVTAYEQVTEVPQPDPEILQKADLAAGEMYDLLGKRDLAVKKYQAVVVVDASTPLAESANRYLKDPYRGE